MLCKKCGQNLEGASGDFCCKCGTKTEQILETKEAEIVPDDKTVSAVMYCTECGQSSAGGDGGICQECITKKANASSAPQSHMSEMQQSDIMQTIAPFAKKKPIVVVAGVVALVAIFVIIVVMVTGRSFNPPYEVISIGRYDEIHYIGDSRFLVMRGDWPNTRWGVEDVRGNEIIGFGRFDMIENDFLTHDGNFTVRDGGTFFILNSDGSEIASFDRFDWVSYVTENRFIASTGSGQNTRAGVWDARGTEIISMGRYSQIAASQDGRWFIVWDGNRVGALDERGAEVVSMGRYDNLHFAPGDRFIASTGDWPTARFAVLDSRGNEVIPLGRFDEILIAGDTHFIAREGNTWGVLNTQGSEVIPFRYDHIQHVGNNNFIVVDGDRHGVLDVRGQEIISLGRYDEINYAHSDRFRVRSGGEWDSRIWEWEGARWGILDSRGDEVIPLGRYDGIYPVPGDRFIVRSGGTINLSTWEWDGARWGVLDARGNEVISPGRYDNISVFHAYWHNVDVDYGFVVRSGDRIGVRDIDGQEIIPIGRYDNVDSMHNGLAIVDRGGRIGVINTRRIND